MTFLSTLVAALTLAAAQPPAPAPEPKPEPFSLDWPASGTITDGYGPRWGRMHQGIDIGVLRRLPVVAAADGRVEATGYVTGYEGYGLVVLLAHGEGRKTLYAHLSRIDVPLGARVGQGRRLGLAGCTGSCTGTHLHFELRKRGVPVNPMPFIAR